MNKKDVAAIRKQFKLDNELLKVDHIYKVYIQQESSEIFHEESQAFPLLDIEQQELFLNSFRRVLGGRLGVKLFNVKFTRQGETETDDHTQRILYEGLYTKDIEEWKVDMQSIAEKMVQDVQYEKDMVVTFIRGNYYKPTKRHSDEADVADTDEMYTTPFILCSMNQTNQPKPSLVFDFVEKEYKAPIMLDPIINLTSPIGGFLFPTFTDSGADVNHILYAAGKANKPDYDFIENILNGEEIMTAEDDKAVFEEIIKEVIGEQVNTHTLANVYEEIKHMMDAEDEDEEGDNVPALDTVEVTRVLKASGVEDVDTGKVERAFQRIIEDETYELTPSHVVPSYTSKSIKIETKVANIAISPQDLRYVRQVTVNGKRCILIEVEEDTMIEGFTLLPEELLE